MNDPFKHNDSSIKADFISSPISDNNSYTDESQSFSEKKNETSQQNIKNKKFRYVDSQEIRERRKKISQDRQSSPSTHSVSRTSYQQPRNVIIALILIIGFIAVIWLRPVEDPSTFFKKFADTTNDIMTNVNSIDLPGANAVMEHTVACRRAANMIQKSVAFEPHSSQMATGLRNFGDSIKEAGNLLKKMYSKGSAVYVSFDIEIEAMMERVSSSRRQQGDAKSFKDRLNSLIMKFKEFWELVGRTYESIHDVENTRNDVENIRNDAENTRNDAEYERDSLSIHVERVSSSSGQQGEAKYFKDRLNSLIMKFKEFRELVGRTYKSILDAENIRNDAEGYMFDGLREAEVFVVKNNCSSAKDNDEKCHSVEVAKRELGLVNGILDHLYNTAEHLDKMEKILKYYEDKLLDVSAELENANEVFEVTKADLKHLQRAVDSSRACLYKFERLSE